MIAWLLAAQSASAASADAEPDAGADAGLAPSWVIMAPPEEDDPGACHCFWGGDMQAEVPLVLLALPAAALGARRKGRKTTHK